MGWDGFHRSQPRLCRRDRHTSCRVVLPSPRCGNLFRKQEIPQFLVGVISFPGLEHKPVITGLLGTEQLYSQAILEPNMLEELKSKGQIKKISVNPCSGG